MTHSVISATRLNPTIDGVEVTFKRFNAVETSTGGVAQAGFYTWDPNGVEHVVRGTASAISRAALPVGWRRTCYSN